MYHSHCGAVLGGQYRPGRRAAVLLLAGGTGGIDERPVAPYAPPVLRMLPFAWQLNRCGYAAHVLRYAAHGWGEHGASRLAEARWAVDIISQWYPRSPLVLLGHSLGGRVALHLLANAHTAARTGADPGAPTVPSPLVGAVALAPWLPTTDGTTAPMVVSGRVVIVHGAEDISVPAAQSAAWAAQVPGTIRLLLQRGEHTMLRSAGTWHRLAIRGVRHLLDHATGQL